MSKKTMVSVAAIVVCLGMFFAAPASAQSSTGATLQDVTSQHHQMMYQMMKDMTERNEQDDRANVTRRSYS